MSVDPPVEPAQAPTSFGLPSAPCRELRVCIPTDTHRQLIALKMLRGVTLARAVTLALDLYFAGRANLPAAARPVTIRA